ncbi:MAG: ribosomal large subunit pseudouridine synthase rRNA synthase [Candidatus Parcubacteria bacterium]|jgi:23S rRNA pseudouridine1911/1915/1917 synthase
MKILHEEKDFIIVDKPAGVVTHPDGKPGSGDKETLCEQLVKLYPDLSKIGEPMQLTEKGGTLITVERPGVVHRLDAETSGVMIFARTKKFFDHIKTQFQEHLVQKEYRAFVWGWFKEGTKKGIINAPIGRSRTDFRQYSAGRFARGDMRDAVTEYEVLGEFETKKFPKVAITPRFSYMSLRPRTGRTHQLRVHMKVVNHVIVADTLYAPSHPKALGFGRQALHAHMINFVDLKGKMRNFESPLPKDFQAAVELYIDKDIV